MALPRRGYAVIDGVTDIGGRIYDGMRAGRLASGIVQRTVAEFLTDLAAKVRRGQHGRVLAGHVPGGLSYGYAIKRPIDERGELVRGKRSINAIQAAVITRIFSDYVAGKSPRSIAAQLNREGIKSPSGRQWNASTINGNRERRNGILLNELYVGR